VDVARASPRITGYHGSWESQQLISGSASQRHRRPTPPGPSNLAARIRPQHLRKAGWDEKINSYPRLCPIHPFVWTGASPLPNTSHALPQALTNTANTARLVFDCDDVDRKLQSPTVAGYAQAAKAVLHGTSFPILCSLPSRTPLFPFIYSQPPFPFIIPIPTWSFPLP